MVKFKVNYGAHISRAFVYLDYDRLKILLHENEEEQLHPTPGQRPLHSDFLAEFDQELHNVDSCFTDHMIDLEYSVSDATLFATEYTNLSADKSKKNKVKRKAQEAALKRSFTFIYDKLTKIETYCLLNRTAAIKILKKHDKLARHFGGEEVFDSYMQKVNRTKFGGENKINDAKQYVEELYAKLFCDDVMEEARGKLQLAKIHHDPQIRLSAIFKVGVVITLLVWLIYAMLLSPNLSLLYFTTEDPSVYVYAVVGSLLIYRWLWGFCVYMWDSVDIDYILILDLDASKHMPSADEIFSDVGNLSILYMINALIFHSLRQHHTHRRDIEPSWNTAEGAFALFSDHAYVLPILLVVGTVVRMTYSVLLPASYGVFSSKIFWNLFTAPFSPVALRHTFAADILTSQTKVISGALLSVCYFTSGSFLHASDPASTEAVDRFATCHSGSYGVAMVLIFAIPYYIRMMQCLRQRRDYFIRRRKQKERDIERGIVPASKPKSPRAYVPAASSSRGAAGDGGRGGDRGSGSSAGDGTAGTATARSSQSGHLEMGSWSGRRRGGAGSSSAERKEHPEPPTSFRACYSYDSNKRNDDDDDGYGGYGRTIVHYTGRDAQLPASEIGEEEEEKLSEIDPDEQDDEVIDGDGNVIDDDDDEDNMTTARGRGDTGSTGDSDSKQPELSKSESRDLPVPPLLKSLCPTRKNSILPKSVRKFWNTVWVWPYSYNALRYFLSICVVVFGAYPPQDPLSAAYMWWYIPLSIISALYGCYWDIANDFKLMQFSSTRPLLRDKILYEGNERFYYFVLVVDPLLRFLWTLSFTPYGHNPFLVLFEIARRALWACIRMELGYIQELARRH